MTASVRRLAVRTVAILASLGLLASLLVPVAAASGPGSRQARTIDHGWKIVATGLNNPRGIDPGPFGSLIVAEAGKGGTTDCQVSTDPESGQPETVCLGQTGAVDLIFGTHKFKIATLPSIATTDGVSAAGPTHAVFGPKGLLVSLMGVEPLPYTGDASDFGKIMRLNYGSSAVAADLLAYETAHNPDGAQIDSDPYGLALNGRGEVVTDAAANDLLSISRTGVISTLAVFPSQMALAPAILGLPAGAKIPAESVPTAVTRGPDGAWYVGELTGFPFQKGLARVWRVVPGHAPTVFARGFTNIIDLQFDKHGRLYVLELAKNGLLQAMSSGGDPTGALIRINRNHTRTTIATTGLTLPGGVAIDDQGHVFVTNNSIFPGIGQVIRIR
jgi:hypothetical protein